MLFATIWVAWSPDICLYLSKQVFCFSAASGVLDNGIPYMIALRNSTVMRVAPVSLVLVIQEKGKKAGQLYYAAIGIRFVKTWFTTDGDCGFSEGLFKGVLQTLKRHVTGFDAPFRSFITRTWRVNISRVFPTMTSAFEQQIN